MKIFDLEVGKEYLYNNEIFKLDEDRILLMKLKTEWKPFVGVNYNDVVKFDFEEIKYNILQLKPIDTRVLVKDIEDFIWLKRHFAGYKNGVYYVFRDGLSSYTNGTRDLTSYKYIKLYPEEDDKEVMQYENI